MAGGTSGGRGDGGRSRASVARRTLRGVGLAVALLCGGVGCNAPAPENDAARREEIESLFSEVRERYAEVPVVTRDEVTALGDRVVFVDVRGDEEIAVSTLPGAIPSASFDPSSLPEGAVVVAYCTIGERSGSFARTLREDGIDARNLDGGILGWAHEGGAVVGPDGAEVHRAHVYGARWDLLPLDWEGVR